MYEEQNHKNYSLENNNYENVNIETRTKEHDDNNDNVIDEYDGDIDSPVRTSY